MDNLSFENIFVYNQFAQVSENFFFFYVLVNKFYLNNKLYKNKRKKKKTYPPVNDVLPYGTLDFQLSKTS